jgi:hypothetical protein
MISESGFISLAKSTGQLRTVRTQGAIEKVKDPMKRKEPVSTRKLARELKILERSVCRILRDNLLLKPYKKTVKPFLTDTERAKRVKLANWIRKNYRKEDTMRILFSNEKMYDIDGIYNSQNDRV